MAITDISKEVEELRKDKLFVERIDNLSRERAAFVIKALLLANHVYPSIVEQTVALAETLRTND